MESIAGLAGASSWLARSGGEAADIANSCRLLTPGPPGL